MNTSTDPLQSPDPVRRLRRRDDGRVIAGVAGGIADYLGIDVGVVRLLFVILTVFGGAGLCLYLVGWAAIPPADGSEPFAETVLRRVREAFSPASPPPPPPAPGPSG